MTPEYKIWISIKARVFPTENRYTKEEGLGMEESWRIDFKTFLKDVGIRPSDKHKLVRKDTNKGFYKDNCEWALKPNTQRKVRYKITYKGITETISYWSKKIGISYTTLLDRKKSRWDDDKIIETPPDKHNKKKRYYREKM